MVKYVPVNGLYPWSLVFIHRTILVAISWSGNICTRCITEGTIQWHNTSLSRHNIHIKLEQIFYFKLTKKGNIYRILLKKLQRKVFSNTKTRNIKNYLNMSNTRMPQHHTTTMNCILFYMCYNEKHSQQVTWTRLVVLTRKAARSSVSLGLQVSLGSVQWYNGKVVPKLGAWIFVGFF